MTNKEILDAQWRTSSYSGQGGNCVEVALNGTTAGLRDTKHRTAGALAVTPAAFAALRSAVTRR